jgi:hypothetical protein
MPLLIDMPKNLSIYRLTTIIIASSCGFIFIMIWARADLGYRLPPENHTASYMQPLQTRILRYAKNNNRLPASLQELPLLIGYTNRTTDVWNNEIRLIVKGTNITLMSYGKDQKVGGCGDDRDVVGTFEARTQSGAWAEELSGWSVRPLHDNTKCN